MSIEAMKQRLEELEKIHSDPMLWRSRRSKINFLRQAIEEAEKQEPYGYFRYDIRLDAWVQSRDSNKGVAFYTHPPKRESLTEWLPIETVPKDGTAVLVMRDIWPGTATGRAEKCTGHNTYVAAWWADEGNSGEWVCYMDRIEEPVCPIDPTHWMPLPAPPIEAAHGIKEEA